MFSSALCSQHLIYILILESDIQRKPQLKQQPTCCMFGIYAVIPDS